MFSRMVPANGGHTAGLYNLGNTCYMNSTLQCLHSVPELNSELIKYPGNTNNLDQSSHLLTIATRDLFGDLDRNVKLVSPMQFWMMLHKKYPQFGQLQNGAFMQHVFYFSSTVQERDSGSPEAVMKLFGIDLVSRVHCAESGEENSEAESVYSLKCHISHEVNHLHEGLKHI